jgi:hypothetical protein
MIPSTAVASITGQMKGKVSPVSKALSYTVRYAPVPTGGGTPVKWRTDPDQVEGRDPSAI